MRLYPALKLPDGSILKGQDGDRHKTISADYPDPSESYRGFVDDKGNWYSRKSAIMALRKEDIKTFRKLSGRAINKGLHSEDIIKAYGTEMRPVPTKEEQKPVEQVEAKDPIDLSAKSVLVWDRGLYLYIAEKLAQTYKKVYYYLPSSDPYPCSKLHNIATGIKGVERCTDFWGTLDKVDLVCFFDVYDGALQQFLRDKGYRVFGSGKAEILETDKIFFMEKLEELGLPLPKTYLAEGLDDLLKYLEKEGGEKWLKGLTRGDFETKKYTGMDHFQPFVDDLKRKLGKRIETIEILVQDPIDSECEAGWDGWVVDGQFTKNALCGYEVKDKLFVASVQEEPAEIVSVVNDKFAQLYKELNYRGAHSTEIRITKDGVPYYIDATQRVGSPPGELMSEIYENYAEVVWQVAGGELPLPIPKKKYGAQAILSSDWYKDDHEMYIEFPEKYRDNIKLSNFYVRDNKTYIVPNETEQYFGSVVAVGDTIEEAIEKVKEICEAVKAEKLHCEDDFDDAVEVIECGRKFGIEF